MNADGEVRHEAVFRERWLARQSTGPRAGELIKQPGWIDAGLIGLGGLLGAGAVAATTITIGHSAALSAVVSGTSVTAVRAGDVAPAPGTPVQFRDASGAAVPGVVTQISDTEVVAQLSRPEPTSAGELVVPAGRRGLISLLLPHLG